jgi:hypothetical protein
MERRVRVVVLSIFALIFFTLGEVQLLCSVLQDNFGLACSIHKHGANRRIYIRARSMEVRFREISIQT